MYRKFVLAVTAATLAVAPAAVQAASARTASSVSNDAEDLHGGAMFGIGLFLVATLIFGILYHDDDDDFAPVSP